MVERNYLVEREFTIKTYEVDYAGILSNQVYQRWLEDLRTDMLAQFMNIKDLTTMSSVPVLAHTEVDFKRPGRLADTVMGRMWVEEMGGPKWALRAEFTIDGAVCAKAFQWGVFVDSVTFRPTDAPEVLPKVDPSTGP